MGCAEQEHKEHGGHVHQAGCGHTAVTHEGHTDYLHGGHLHHVHDGHVDEHEVSAGGANPDRCDAGHAWQEHEAGHRHGPGCGHQAIPHGGHVDYVVEDHLHHVHAGHCDDHGPVSLA
jgi:hypothetical protein